MYFLNTKYGFVQEQFKEFEGTKSKIRHKFTRDVREARPFERFSDADEYGRKYFGSMYFCVLGNSTEFLK